MSSEFEAAGDRIEEFLARSRNKLGLSGFSKFILRGNVVDLATGVVIGAAFTAVVNSLVKDFLTPLIGAAAGVHCAQPTSAATGTATTPALTCSTFADHYFTLNGSKFYWGDFINAILTLIIVGLALYYFVVIPVNHLMERFKPETAPGTPTRVCPECKSSIPYDASRCAFCTCEVPPASPAEVIAGAT